MMKISRAEKAGNNLGEAILEQIHLMYQSNTAKNFYKGLMNKLQGNENNWKPVKRKTHE